MDISASTATGDTKPGEDPTEYISKKTKRGPLPKEKWWEVSLKAKKLRSCLEKSQLSSNVRLQIGDMWI